MQKFFGSTLVISLLSSCLFLDDTRAAEPRVPAVFQSAESPYESDNERLKLRTLKQYGVEGVDANILDKLETAKRTARMKMELLPEYTTLRTKELSRKVTLTTLESQMFQNTRASSTLLENFTRPGRGNTPTTLEDRFKERQAKHDAYLKHTKRDKADLTALKTLNTKLQQTLDAELAKVLTPEERASLPPIEADFLYTLEADDSFPNDPEVNNQWEIGALLTQFPEHFDTPASTSERIIVAIIDTGIDYTHDDLIGHLYNPTTCFDETGTTTPNGCPYGGWDYVDDDNDPMPGSGETHGTRIAGIIGAQNDSNLGIASLSNNLVDIMPIRVTNGQYIELGRIIDAIYFAVENGADVINMSFSGPTYSATLKSAIEYAEANDVLVVAAAGNSGLDIDSTPIYPASYNVSNVIAVAAQNIDHTLASFSNYGDVTVDFAAPGTALVTTDVSDRYTVVNGTSFAAAVGSAMAGALLAQGEDPLTVFASLDESPTLSERTISGRVLGTPVDLPPTTPYPFPQVNATTSDPMYGDFYIQSKGGVKVASGTYELSYDKANPSLSAPSTISPGSSATNNFQTYYGNRHTFSWNAVPSATHYGLYIRDLTTGLLVYDNEYVVARPITISNALGNIFIAGHEYRWNMQSYDSNHDYSPFSGLRYFKIANAPTQPNGVAPGSLTAPGTPYSGTSLNFSWDNVNADYYKLTIRNRNTGVYLLDDYVVSGTSHTVTSLQNGVEYVWDVTACLNSPGGCSSYSPNRYFTIGTVNQAPNIPDLYTCGTTVPKNTACQMALFHYYDPNGDTVRFQVDWGDGSSYENAPSYVATNVQVLMSHTYTATGTPCVRARSYDSGGLYSSWSACKYISVTQTGTGTGPDLIGVLRTNTDSLSASGSTTVNFDVKNIGTSSATNDFGVDFYLSSDKYINPDLDQWVGTYNVTSDISANGTFSNSKALVLPDADESVYYGDGEYYIGMVVDAQNTVTEGSEGNNVGRGLSLDIKTVFINGTKTGGTKFTIATIASQTVGTPFTLTVTSNSGSYNGDLQISSSLGIPSKRAVTLKNGSGSTQISLDTPGVNRITVSANGITGVSNEFTVGGGYDEGDIVIKVVDKKGEPLVNVPVSLRCGGMQASSCASIDESVDYTDSSGITVFTNKYASGYQVSIEYDGHTTKEPVTVGPNMRSHLQIDIPIPSDDNLNPVIFLPGLMGSTEGDGTLEYPFIKSPLSEGGNNADKLIISNYGTVLPYLTQGWDKVRKFLTSGSVGYSEDKIFECPWDWRKSAHDAMEDYLLKCIKDAKLKSSSGKVDIIAHSMGAVVARAYIQSNEHYGNDIGKVAFLGGPHEGGSTAYTMWMGRPYSDIHKSVAAKQIKYYINNEYDAKYKSKIGAGLVFDYTWGLLGTPSIETVYGDPDNLVNDVSYTKNFVREHIKSVKDMLPTYKFLGTGENSKELSIHMNETLKSLNGESCGSGGCEMVYEPASSRFGTSTNKVIVKDFVNTGLDTPFRFIVKPGSENVAEDGDVIAYENGEFNMETIKGDGTVIESSAISGLPSATKYDTKDNNQPNIKHFVLLGYVFEQVAEFLIGQDIQPSSYELEALMETEPILSLSLSGAHQPIITLPDGTIVGIEADGDVVDTTTGGGTTFEVTNDGSMFSLASPKSGAYTIMLHGPYDHDYDFTIAYGDDQRSEEYLFDAIYDGSTTTITFTLTPTAGESSPVISFTSALDVPRTLTATKSSTTTKLIWTAPLDATPTGYRIYSRPVQNSTLAYVTQVSTTTYTTSDTWAGASTTMMKRYQVSAVYANGEESFLSNVAYNNDEDQDGLPDHLEVEEGTSTSSPDTDSDGLTDGEEYFNYGTDPADADSDNDGINDYDEVTPGGSGTTTPATAAQVYVDGLENGWTENGSWGSVTNLMSTANVAQGTRAIQIATNGTWGALSLRNGSGFNTSAYDVIRLAYHPGNITNHVTRIRFLDTDHTTQLGNDRNLSDYITEDVSGGLESKWYTVEIPLDDAGIENDTIGDIIILTSNTATYHIDNIAFGIATANVTTIYDNALQNGWSESGSWSVTTNFAHPTTTYASSSDAVRAQYSTAWSGVALTTSQVVQGSTHTALHLAYNPGPTGGHTEYIMLRNASSADLTENYLSLDDYIPGTPATNTWYSVTIPLTDLGASTSTVKDIILLTSASSTVYYDALYFTKPTTTTGGGSTTTTSATVYAEGLASPWTDGGDWLATTTFYSTVRKSGSYGLEIAYQEPWAGNTLTATSSVDTTGKSVFRLSYNPGATTSQTTYVKFTDASSIDHSSYISLSDYISGTQQVNTWHDIDIPLSTLGVTPGELVKDIFFTTSATATVYFDSISFAATTTSSGSGASSTNSTIYSDMFHNTWTHGGEWLSTTTHTSATRTQGYYGIETKFTNGSWSDMAMTAATPVSSTGFDSLHIAYNPGTTTSHTVYVQTRDENNTDHGSSITLNSYITNMATSTWYSLDIPFSDLGISSGELIKHIIFISQDGPTVYIDDVYLGIPNTGGPNTFSEGMVTLSFDDGWLDHYTEALPILDNENIDATFYIVSEETIQATDLPELVQNRSLESGSIGAPDDWTFNTWGTNDASSTYPVTGIDGADAARVDITNYTDGDAKWYFDDVTVYPDNTYTVSYQYRSDVPNDLTVRFTLQDDSFVYVTATTNPMSTSWASTTATVRSPQNSKSMTVFPILASVGYLEIDNMSVKRNQAYVSPSQVLSIEASGHEIGSHTRHHVALTQVSSALQQDEIETSKDDLLDVGKIGVSSITSLAYPYGDHNTTVQNLTSAHYGNARSTDEGFNYTNTNKYALKIQTVDRNTTLADIEEWVDTARTDKTWLILMFHQIDELTHHTLGISPDLLEDIVTSIANDGIRTVTVTEGVGEME